MKGTTPMIELSNIKEYYVGTDREHTGYNATFYIYGIHKELETAVADQLKRLHEYNQNTALYGITLQNEVVRLNGITK